MIKCGMLLDLTVANVCLLIIISNI